MPYQCTHLLQGEGRKGNKISTACSLNPERPAGIGATSWLWIRAPCSPKSSSEHSIHQGPPDAEAFLPGRPGQRLPEPLQALSSMKRESCEPANLAIWVQCAGVPGAGRGAHAHGARMDATFVPLSQILQLGNVTKRSYACMHALVHMIERSLGCMGWRRRAS